MFYASIDGLIHITNYILNLTNYIFFSFFFKNLLKIHRFLFLIFLKNLSVKASVPDISFGEGYNYNFKISLVVILTISPSDRASEFHFGMCEFHFGMCVTCLESVALE